jgi:hypothetical protein
MAVLLLLLMLIANFYAFRQIKVHGVGAYFYQRMLVAYEVGGMPGLRQELFRVRERDKNRQELNLAKELEKELTSLGSPQEFLSANLAEKIKKINFFQELRNWAIILICVLLILRVWVTKIILKA